MYAIILVLPVDVANFEGGVAGRGVFRNSRLAGLSLQEISYCSDSTIAGTALQPHPTTPAFDFPD